MLIFDIGPHDGADTAYYLGLGATVIAVDADAKMVERLRNRFSDSVRSGQLTILRRAVADNPDRRIEFHLSKNSLWNSVRSDVAERGASTTSTVEVETVTLAELVSEFGLPEYCKIDIEGFDAVAVRTLGEEHPRFISVETECATQHVQPDPLETLCVLQERGYTRFKLVDQMTLAVVGPDSPLFRRRKHFAWRLMRKAAVASHLQSLNPEVRARRSVIKSAGYPFAIGSSGPFGTELGGRWLDGATAAATLVQHRETYFTSAAPVPWGFWCDWHATD